MTAGRLRFRWPGMLALATALVVLPAVRADEFARAGFNVLSSFTFTLPEWRPGNPDDLVPPTGIEQFPQAVRALDGRRVAVTGFMLPVKVENGLVREFLLLRDPGLCCYGVVPELTDWVTVRMRGKGVKALMDVPISFVGTLHVGARWEGSYVTGIYHLDGERMLGAGELGERR